MIPNLLYFMVAAAFFIGYWGGYLTHRKETQRRDRIAELKDRLEQQSTTCPECHGVGVVNQILPEQKAVACRMCKGRGRVVTVPAEV